MSPERLDASIKLMTAIHLKKMVGRFKGEKGDKGDKGDNVDLELVRAEIKRAVSVMPKDGKDADPVLMKRLIAEAVAELPKPKDGKDGEDGKDAIIDDELLSERIREGIRSIRFYGPAGQGAPGVGVPVGGAATQVLAKKSAADYDTEWVTGGGGAAWGAITGTLSSQADLQSALDAKADIASLSGVATSGAYSDLSGLPALKAVATSGVYGDLTGLPALKAVATSGVYADLTGKPALQAVATSGAYADLTGTPTLGSVASTAASTWAFAGHRHDASHVTSGTMDTARLGSGTANASTVLYGNQTWAALPAGGSGTVTSIDVSSAVAGITAAGGPVSTNGTITLSTSGIFANESLASSGTASSTTFLRGDRTWAAPNGATNPFKGRTQIGANSSQIIVTFTPMDGYFKLVAVIQGYDGAGGIARWRCNGDATTSYCWVASEPTDAASSGAINTTGVLVGETAQTTPRSPVFCEVTKASSSQVAYFRGVCGDGSNAKTTQIGMIDFAGIWGNVTQSVSSFTLHGGGVNLLSGSYVEVYGFPNA